MSLPKIDVPIYETKIPSTGIAAKFRPITTKEEKLLLMAKEGGETSDVLSAVKQIVNNCLLEPKGVIDELALFDLEFLYIRIRAVSISNKLKLSFRDNDDEVTRDFTIDLEKIEVSFPEKDRRNIPVNKKVKIELRYPPASLYDDKAFLETTGEKVYSQLAVRCVNRIYDGANISYDWKTGKVEELTTWIDDLPVEVYDQMKEFFLNLPTLKHEIVYTNKKDAERKIVLTTLNDFFFLH